MKKILFAGFKGDDNSAKLLLDKLATSKHVSKLYLENDFGTCALQIIEHISSDKYDLILAFGQKPVIKSIYFEQCGKVGEQKYFTEFCFEELKTTLEKRGQKIKFSENAGNYLCNHVYGIGLQYIKQQKKATQFAFIHIPNVKNLTDIDFLARSFGEYVKYIL